MFNLTNVISKILNKNENKIEHEDDFDTNLRKESKKYFRSVRNLFCNNSHLNSYFEDLYNNIHNIDCMYKEKHYIYVYMKNSPMSYKFWTQNKKYGIGSGGEIKNVNKKVYSWNDSQPNQFYCYFIVWLELGNHSIPFIDEIVGRYKINERLDDMFNSFLDNMDNVKSVTAKDKLLTFSFHNDVSVQITYTKKIKPTIIGNDVTIYKNNEVIEHWFRKSPSMSNLVKLKKIINKYELGDKNV